MLEHSECCITLIYSASGSQLFHYCSQMFFTQRNCLPQVPQINVSVKIYSTYSYLYC